MDNCVAWGEYKNTPPCFLCESLLMISCICMQSHYAFGGYVCLVVRRPKCMFWPALCYIIFYRLYFCHFSSPIAIQSGFNQHKGPWFITVTPLSNISEHFWLVEGLNVSRNTTLSAGWTDYVSCHFITTTISHLLGKWWCCLDHR